MESVCSKIEKLQTIKTSLCNILDFVMEYFPLINSHSNDFISDDQWETTLPEPIRAELLNLSEKTLCELPMLGYSRNQKLKSDDKACTASLIDLNLGTCCQEHKAKTLTEGTLFEKCENLTRFCQQAWKCSIEGLGIAVTVQDLYNNLHTRPKHSAVLLTKHFMNQKKSHEVEKMAELCAFLAEYYSCQLVVDIGSGKGYLGSYLFLQHGLPILGIDAMTTNTAGAIWRRDKLLKQWNGLLQRAKDAEKGKQFSHKERKKRSRENKQSSELNSTPHNCELCPDYQQQSDKDTMPTFKQIQTSQTRNLSPMYVPVTMYVNISCNLTEVARCAVCEYEQDTFRKKQGYDTSSFECIDNLGNITNNERVEDFSNNSKPQNETFPNKSVSSEYHTNNVLSEHLSELCDACNSSFDIGHYASVSANCDHCDKRKKHCKQKPLEWQNITKSDSTIFLQHSNQNFAFGIANESDSLKTNNDLTCESNIGIKEVEMTISYPSVDETDIEVNRKFCTGSQTITETRYTCINPNLETKAGESYRSCSVKMQDTDKLHRDQRKFEADLSPMMLTGLHTCGDLGSSMLELFVNNPDVAVLCGVSCCYHLIREKFAKEDDATEDNAQEGSSYIGFPLSSFLQERQVLLGRKAKYLASQSVYRITQSSELQGESFFPRALLQVILQDVTGHTTYGVKGLGKLTQQSDDMYQYIQTAFQRLKIPQDKISTCLIDSYLEKYGHMRQKLAAFFQLRATLAPCIEAIILLDRVCYLLEQENVADVHLVQLFDPVLSPRCYGIVTVKKST